MLIPPLVCFRPRQLFAFGTACWSDMLPRHFLLIEHSRSGLIISQLAHMPESESGKGREKWFWVHQEGRRKEKGKKQTNKKTSTGPILQTRRAWCDPVQVGGRWAPQELRGVDSVKSSGPPNTFLQGRGPEKPGLSMIKVVDSLVPLGVCGCVHACAHTHNLLWQLNNVTKQRWHLLWWQCGAFCPSPNPVAEFFCPLFDSRVFTCSWIIFTWSLAELSVSGLSCHVGA